MLVHIVENTAISVFKFCDFLLEFLVHTPSDISTTKTARIVGKNMIFLKYFLYEYIKKELSRQGLAIFEKYFDNFENLPTNRAKGIVIYVKGANLSTKKFASAQKIIL